MAAGAGVCDAINGCECVRCNVRCVYPSSPNSSLPDRSILGTRQGTDPRYVERVLRLHVLETCEDLVTQDHAFCVNLVREHEALGRANPTSLRDPAEAFKQTRALLGPASSAVAAAAAAVPAAAAAVPAASATAPVATASTACHLPDTATSAVVASAAGAGAGAGAGAAHGASGRPGDRISWWSMAKDLAAIPTFSTRSRGGWGFGGSETMPTSLASAPSIPSVPEPAAAAAAAGSSSATAPLLAPSELVRERSDPEAVDALIATGRLNAFKRMLVSSFGGQPTPPPRESVLRARATAEAQRRGE